MTYNLEKLEELSGGDQEFIDSVITVFVEDTPADVKALKQAVASGDFENIYRQAHKIKPNLDLLGMQEAKNLVLEIENDARKREPLAVIEDKVERVCGMIEDTIKVLIADFRG
ncbi:Hpt domain-containing protein [Sinomicrobium soli]|uniref:Hpt domain-containing protein n=1 Tax=Sinomicrobium sp. N-1-3-6 TaxID=2219864 RepID=UPI001374B71E|nr:Hpt domain-containing protein [Sinomicrobium sp. N-1-3-6]